MWRSFIGFFLLLLLSISHSLDALPPPSPAALAGSITSDVKTREARSSADRVNVTLCCISFACRPDTFPVAYFAAAAGWWRGQVTADVQAGSVIAAPDPFDDPRVGVSAGWPRLKVTDFRVLSKGDFAASARDMLRSYTLLDADATCHLLIGPAASYLVQPLGGVVEHPFWIEFASGRSALSNVTPFHRVNPNVDDFSRAIVGLLQSLESTLSIEIPSVTLLASTDAFSQELTALLMTRLAALKIDVEFIVDLVLDSTLPQAEQALAQLRTARSRVVIPTLLMAVAKIWDYFAEAANAAARRGEFDLILIFGSGACGMKPILPGMLCASAWLNATQKVAFTAARARQPRAFTDDINRRLHAMGWPNAAIPIDLVQIGLAALVIDAVTFGLGAINAFVTQNNRLPRTSTEMSLFAVQGSTTNTLDGRSGYVETDGISGTVHLAHNGNRLDVAIDILNYHTETITKVGTFSAESGTVTLNRSALYLGGAFYMQPLRPQAKSSPRGSTRGVNAALLPVVATAVCSVALIAAIVGACSWWRRRWPSRKERLARRNRWAVRGVALGRLHSNGRPSHVRNRSEGDSRLAPPSLDAKAAFPAWMPTAYATIVWTDIEKSTALWAQLPRAMGRAIDAHHALIRALLWAHHGYEARTAGDAFMIVFGNAADAVEFSMVLQVALVNDVPWSALAEPHTPPRILPSRHAAKSHSNEQESELASASPSVTTGHSFSSSAAGVVDPFENFYRSGTSESSKSTASLAAAAGDRRAGSGSNSGRLAVPRSSSDVVASPTGQPHRQWAGLRVRVGMSTGLVAVTSDPHTGAFEYAGPAADTAARVCLIARGGQTVMTEHTLRAALAHAGLDPRGDTQAAPVLVQHSTQESAAGATSLRSSGVRPSAPPGAAGQRPPPLARLNWLLPTKTVEEQVQKRLSHAGYDDSTDARLLAPPPGGRAPPYAPQIARTYSVKAASWPAPPEFKAATRKPKSSLAARQHIFPRSTHIWPLGVYGMPTIHGSFSSSLTSSVTPTRERSSSGKGHRRRGASADRGAAARAARGGEQLSFQSLYEALPSQLAGRKFSGLRLKLLPGLMKYRDANNNLIPARGHARSPVRRKPTLRAIPSETKMPDGHPLSPLSPDGPTRSNAPALRRLTCQPVTPHHRFPDADSDICPAGSSGGGGLDASPPRNAEATLETFTVPHSPPPVFGPSVNPQLTDNAMAALFEVLVAPLAPRERRRVVNEISNGWRLPPPPRGVVTSPEAHVSDLRPEASAAADALTVSRLAQRCARVYSARSDPGAPQS